MRTVITGGTGLVGSHLQAKLWQAGHPVTVLTRKPTRDHERAWDPGKGQLDLAALEEADWIVHLAGEPLMQGRWTDARRRRILESRVRGTQLIAQAAARMDPRPQVLLCASGSSYYAEGGPWPENGPTGDTFLADVVRQWEAAAQPARDAGIRVVHTRMGAVMSPQGGALKLMLPTFKLGLGGWVGDGQQRVPWIHIADAVGAMMFALEHKSLAGPVNVCAPEPATNKELSRTLGAALHRPVLVPVPGAAASLMFGEVANDILLYDNAMEPRKLAEAGFEWRFADLRDALDDLVDQS